MVRKSTFLWKNTHTYRFKFVIYYYVNILVPISSNSRVSNTWEYMYSACFFDTHQLSITSKTAIRSKTIMVMKILNVIKQMHNNRIINWKVNINQNTITSAEERLDLTSVQNLFRARVKSLCFLATSDHILVIHDNQLIILFIMQISSIYSLLFSV